jgi:hypothetical protein
MRHLRESVAAGLCAGLTCLSVVCASGNARAQDAAPASTAPAPASAPAEGWPAIDMEPLPVLNVPAMPAPEADFSADRDLFGETVTDAEKARKQELADGNRSANDPRLLYQRWPRLTIATQAVGGVFGSAIFGLLGGSIGQAADPGDKRFALGGAHGPLFGGLAGTIIGAIGGVWGSGMLFEKDPGLGWTSLGAGVGTLVGAGAAAGFALGLDEGDTATSLAVGSFVACQVGGAVAFNTVFARKTPGPVADKAPIQPPRGRTGPESDDPEMWIFPLGMGEF